jgi:hypothetical protein
VARRNIIECDRHHGEIRNSGGVTKLIIGKGEVMPSTGRTVELCDSCATKLDRFLAGEELEIPP